MGTELLGLRSPTQRCHGTQYYHASYRVLILSVRKPKLLHVEASILVLESELVFSNLELLSKKPVASFEPTCNYLFNNCYSSDTIAEFLSLCWKKPPPLPMALSVSRCSLENWQGHAEIFPSQA